MVWKKLIFFKIFIKKVNNGHDAIHEGYFILRNGN